MTGFQKTGAQRGFTLLEMLVAITVLAIALSSILSAGSGSARTAATLRDKTLALFVARNRLAEIEMLPAWPQTGASNDDVQMGGDTWTWRVNVQGTQDPTLHRVDISVERKSDPQRHTYIQLTTFLSAAGRQTQ